MTRHTQLVCAVGALLATAVVPVRVTHAQAQRPETVTGARSAAALPVRTFTLRQLDVSGAAKLLAPYLQWPGSGAFETGTGMSAITIRGTARELELADSLLALFDRAPRTVQLRFQFIEPIGAPNEDARISEVAGALRELFDAPGYRLLGEGMVTTSESQRFAVSISAGKAPLFVSGMVQQMVHDDRDVRLQVDVHQNAGNPNNPAVGALFRGSLTVQLGKLVVLGSAVPLIFNATARDSAALRRGGPAEPYSQRTIILTVRPQVETLP